MLSREIGHNRGHYGHGKELGRQAGRPFQVLYNTVVLGYPIRPYQAGHRHTVPSAMTVLSGQDLKDAFAAAVSTLEHRRDSINALNVFPVPDGDTGTNLLQTMRAAVENVAEDDELTVAGVFRGLAEGAFWGARGNSGVIFSQFLEGMSHAFDPGAEFSASVLHQAFRMGADAAYGSVVNPVEGTMLTVLKSLALAAADRLEAGETDPLVLWEAAFSASSEALANTPAQLPVLREAGVVDAGGMGVVVVFGGALERLTGQVHLGLLPAAVESSAGLAGAGHNRIDRDLLNDSLGTDWGYCIQFIIRTGAVGQHQAPDAEEIRAQLESIHSESAVVAATADAVRLHVHAPNPAPVLSYGSSLGALNQIAVQYMDHQNHQFVSAQGAGTALKAEEASVAVVSVVSGEGLSGLFLEAGCAGVVTGGQTMNPSVQDLLDSVRDSGAKDTIILPNNPNVVATARQAAGRDPTVHFVSSNSISQGIAALLAFSPSQPVADNLAVMEDARSSVKSIEVTQAVRSAAIAGRTVEAGQYIALSDHKMSAVGATPDGVLREALDQAGLAQDGLVTVYVGADGGWQQAEDLAKILRSEVEGIQVDVLYGGQPNYHYLASVE